MAELRDGRRQQMRAAQQRQQVSIEDPKVMAVRGTDNDWTRNDGLSRVEYADGTTRPYTVEETAEATARAVAAGVQVQADALAAENAALRQELRALVIELNTLVSGVQTIIDSDNAPINSSPAPYIKGLARALKQALLSVRDLIKVIR